MGLSRRVGKSGVVRRGGEGDNLSTMPPPKPDTRQAMRQLIEQIRAAIPLELDEAAACRDGCTACSLKLVAYLASELENWEARLEAGEKPGLAELSRLARSARKIHALLAANGLLQ